jgi:hypothetical protein
VGQKKLWIAEGKSWFTVLNTRSSGSDSVLSTVSGLGINASDAVADLWGKLTSLPEDGRIRVMHWSADFDVTTAGKQWVEYHWNGEEFIEVERHGFDVDYSPH